MAVDCNESDMSVMAGGMQDEDEIAVITETESDSDSDSLSRDSATTLELGFRGQPQQGHNFRVMPWCRNIGFVPRWFCCGFPVPELFQLFVLLWCPGSGTISSISRCFCNQFRALLVTQPKFECIVCLNARFDVCCSNKLYSLDLEGTLVLFLASNYLLMETQCLTFDCVFWSPFVGF